ncbi:MAG: TonB-dependent receptor, partial [Muribaculaceae bacterium]|nr:TonB-dependent receptor [Muribaculaceae bacterium]
FRQVRKEYNLNVGISVNSAMSKSKDLINSARDIPERWAWSVAPYARFRYKFSETRNLNFNYRMRANQPSITQLQPVADVSNPLNIVVGNPELKATFNHNINLRFGDFAQGAQRSIMAMINVDFAQNSIVSTTSYDSTTGDRLTSYTNVDGVWNAMAMNMLSFPFGASKVWYFSSHMFMRYSVTKGINNGVENRSNTFNINYSPGLAFRNSVFDIELRPRYGFQNTTNTVQTASNRNIHTYGGMFNGTYSAPFGLVVSTDLSYRTTSGYTSGYNTSQWIWNGSLAYQFLRDKQAAVTISVYDILGQRKNVFRNVTANYIEDAMYNSLGRYGMLTFTYRFTTFKKGEQPKNRNDEFGGPGRFGPPGGGRPSGGRPGGRPPF